MVCLEVVNTTATPVASTHGYERVYAAAARPVPPPRKELVAILPSFAERYVSTALFEGL